MALAVIIIALGAVIAVASLGPVRAAWSSRAERARTWLYHPDELSPTGPVVESAAPVDVTDHNRLLTQVEPRGWNRDIYRQRNS